MTDYEPVTNVFETLCRQSACVVRNVRRISPPSTRRPQGNDQDGARAMIIIPMREIIRDLERKRVAEEEGRKVAAKAISVFRLRMPRTAPETPGAISGPKDG